jgi:psiF repeat-containing protein
VKHLSALVAAALLCTGTAFAADATATAPAPAVAKGDHHCRDSANDKKLSGAARKSFIKKCLADAKAAK